LRDHDRPTSSCGPQGPGPTERPQAARKAAAGKKAGGGKAKKTKSGSARSKPARKKPAAKKKAAPRKSAKKSTAKKKAAPEKSAKKAPAKKKAAPRKSAKKAAGKKKAVPRKSAKRSTAKKKAAPGKSAKKAPAKKKAAPEKSAAKKAAPKKKSAAKKGAPAKSTRKAPAEKAPPKPTPRKPKAAKAATSGKDNTKVTAQSKATPQSKAGGVLVGAEDELSPVRSSKTSGPLVRVTSSAPARPAVVPGGDPGGHAFVGAGSGGPVVGGPSRIPPEVRPDPSILTLDENRGALSAHGYRLILMHPESLIEMQVALEEKLGLEAGQILFRGGYAIGLREARRLKDAEVEEEEIVEHVAKRCSAHGWGIFKVESLDLWRHELVFRVDHSPFAYAYGTSTTGVDHLVRGVFSGVCEVIFDKKVVATEAMCRAMGDPYCQFLVG